MNIFSNKINELLPKMTNSQKSVAKYYLDNFVTVAFLTLDEVAMKIDVSTTTVIRFARLLGYSGFSEMQKDIQNTLINKVSLPQRVTTLQTSMENQNHLLVNSMQSDIDDIITTFNQLDPTILDNVINTINNASTVYILGLRSSFALAHYFTSRLAQIRPHVKLIQTAGMLFPEDFNGCNENDVCIAFLFPRYSKTTYDLLKWLKRRNTPVILITAPNTKEFLITLNIISCSISSISFQELFRRPYCFNKLSFSALAILGH